MQKPTLTTAILLADLDADSVRWVQTQLEIGGYLPPGQVDGVPGPKTHEALAKFKTSLSLSYPAAVGPSTIDALANLTAPAPRIQKPTLTNAVLLANLDADAVRWVQTRLEIGGYLPPGQVDGIPSPQTHEALAKFKTALLLSYPAAVEPSTVEALENLAPPHVVSEQLQGLTQKPLANAGRKEGQSAVLPGIGTVYEHEYIMPGVPLTWGEMTKGLNPKRIPNSTEHVNNLKALATVFGRVRTQFGSPIGVTSGYRPRALGIGVPDSQHIPGRAMDIYPLNGDFSKLLQVIKAEPAITGIGLGQKNGFLHIDIRPGNRVIFPY